MMAEAAHLGKLSLAAAGKLRGVLGFTLLAAMYRFGRAACQPLLQRLHYDQAPFRWTRSLQAMYEFFRRTLPRLPELRVPMYASRMRPVLVYTDASFSKRGGHHVAVLGLYVVDLVTGREYTGKLALPHRFYRYFAPDKKTYITQAELVVAMAVWYTGSCGDAFHRQLCRAVGHREWLCLEG